MEHTYEEAARLCGVTVETIRQRARRGKLQRGRATNTGRPTVQLTEQDIAAIAAGRSTSVQPVGQPSGQPDAPAVLTGQLERERQRADQATERANRAEGELLGVRDALAEAVKRADRVEARERETRALADQRGADMTAALVRAARAEGELAAARRPAWRRWLGLD